MMKNKNCYWVAMTLFALSVASCAGGKKADTSTEANADTIQMTDMHNAETSLDYFGEYKGTTPAADCPGIKQTLILNKDHTFTLNMIYIEREGADFTESGTFEIEGNIVTTKTAKGQTSFYKVEEGRILMLMADKQPITGALAEHYVLKQEKVY